MEDNKKQIEQTQKTIILVLILGIVAIGLLGFWAFSKYITEVKGTGEAQIARWHFEVKDGIPETKDNIDFPITITEGYKNVADKRLAPGTSGKFEIEIDYSGTEVTFTYDIDIAVKHCPSNLKFYDESEKEIETTRENDDGQNDETTPKVAKLKISKYVKLSEINAQGTTGSTHKETIYWKWPYELEGGTPEQQEAYDKKDTIDSGKEVSMSIAVTATQTLEEPLPTLEELIDGNKIHVGDYVNYQAVKEEDVEALGRYTPTSNEDTNELKKYAYIAETGKTGYTSKQTFKATNNNLEWRVLHVNGDGTVELIPDDTKAIGTLSLNGEAGFVNAEEELKAIGEIYGHGKGAVKGRSIKIKDIEKYSSFVPDYESTDEDTVAAQMITVTNSGYDKQTFYKETTDEEGNITYASEPTVITRNGTIQIRKTYYEHSNAATELNYFQTDEETKVAYEVIFKTKNNRNKTTYWLASRCANPSSSECRFNVRRVDSGRVYAYSLFYSFGSPSSGGCAVCPVVTLDSNIQMVQESKDGPWTIK